MANVEKLQRTLDHIVANPHDLLQHDWRSCFAGWTVRLEGEIPEWSDYERDTDGVQRHSVYVRARSILGLCHEEARTLFFCHNKLADLKAMVTNLQEGRPVKAGIVDTSQMSGSISVGGGAHTFELIRQLRRLEVS